MEEIDIRELLNYYKSKLGLLIIIFTLVCLLGCSYSIFIQPKLQHIVIFSSILSKLAITITNAIFKILFVTSSILGIFGLLLIIIGVAKINKKV